MSTLATSFPGGARGVKVPTLRLRAGIVAGALVLGALGSDLAFSGHATSVVALLVVLLPVWLWKRPQVAPAVLLAAAVLVEQNGQIPAIPITQRIPLFQAIGPGHLQGSDILLLLVGFIYLVKGKEWGPRWWPRSHVTLALGVILAAVLVAVFVGQLHHGGLRVGLMEARPYGYLIVTYFLTAVLVRSHDAIRTMQWGFVVAVGIKAVLGLYVYYGHRHDYPRPESFIGHEPSYLFVIYMMLVLAWWLFNQPGRLRTMATWMLPLVIGCDLVNNRRASWEMLGGALLAFGVIAYHAAPGRRHVLGKCVVVLLLASTVYFPVFWNSHGSLAQPARAIRSQVHPSARDASSDLYRVQENANLQLNIKESGALGKGLGMKINYALPITDISSIDPLIAYIPHNDVLDVLMRLGVLGGIGMWFLIGTGIIAGARLAKSPDRGIAVVGIVLASALVAYALMGASDQGFFFFRVAFVTGALLGMAEAARRLQRANPTPVVPRAHMGLEIPRQMLVRNVGVPLTAPLGRAPALGLGGSLGLTARDHIPARKLPELTLPEPTLPARGLPELVLPKPTLTEPNAPTAPAANPPRPARNFGALLSGQVVTWTMTLVWTLVVPRVLGPEGFGTVTAALSVSGVLAILLGLATRVYLVREIMTHRGEAPKLLGTAIVLRLVMSPLVAVAAFLFAKLAHYNSEQTTALYLAAAMNVLILLNEPMQSMFQAMERMKYMAFSEAINKSAQSLIGILIAFAGLGAVGITGNMAAIAALLVVLNIVWLRRYVHVDFRTSSRRLVTMAKDSFSFWFMGLFYTIYLWIDTIMLSQMDGSKVVGWYGASTTLFQTLLFLPVLLGTAWLPRFVAAFNEGGRAELFRTARTPLELVLVLSAPMAAATAMASTAIVHVLYGPQYAHAVPVVAILSICLAPTYASIMIAQVFIAGGRQAVFQRLMLGATIVNPLLNLILIPAAQRRFHNGAIGAAISLLLTELLITGTAFIMIRQIVDRGVMKRWMRALGSSGAMWGVTYALQPLGAPVALGAGVATLLVLIVVWRIPTEDEKAFIHCAVGRMRTRVCKFRDRDVVNQDRWDG